MIKQLFRTQLITSDKAFAASRQSWNELAGDRLFHRWEWMYHWWRSLGDGHQLSMVVVVDGNGRWIGVAPWYQTWSATHGKVVRQLGSGAACSDYTSVAVRSGFECITAEIISEVIKGNLHPEWFADADLFEFEGHTADDPAVMALSDLMVPGDGHVTTQELAGAWRSRLPDSWEEYEQRLHRSFRRKTRKADRRLHDPDFAARVINTPDQIASVWPKFVQLHQLRRQSLGQPGCFADPKFECFLVNAVTGLAESGRAQINLLEFRDQPLAANLEFIAGDCVYMYQTGFDPKFISLEPGHITFTWAIQSSIERGFRYFDFLRGDEPYKSRWKSERIPMYRTRIVPNRWRARLRQGVREAGRLAGHWSRPLRSATRLWMGQSAANSALKK